MRADRHTDTLIAILRTPPGGEVTNYRHQMAGFEDTYNSLEDLIIRDQFSTTCRRPLETFPNEKSKLILAEMSQAAANFIDTQ